MLNFSRGVCKYFVRLSRVYYCKYWYHTGIMMYEVVDPIFEVRQTGPTSWSISHSLASSVCSLWCTHCINSAAVPFWRVCCKRVLTNHSRGQSDVEKIGVKETQGIFVRSNIASRVVPCSVSGLWDGIPYHYGWKWIMGGMYLGIPSLIWMEYTSQCWWALSWRVWYKVWLREAVTSSNGQPCSVQSIYLTRRPWHIMLYEIASVKSCRKLESKFDIGFVCV